MELVQSFCVGCSTFQQNQGTPFKPQGALKLLLFRLPKDIQKGSDKMVFFSFFLLFSFSLLLVEWQVQPVTNRACNML